jgi:hypothetical protein
MQRFWARRNWWIQLQAIKGAALQRFERPKDLSVFAPELRYSPLK